MMTSLLVSKLQDFYFGGALPIYYKYIIIVGSANDKVFISKECNAGNIREMTNLGVKSGGLPKHLFNECYTIEFAGCSITLIFDPHENSYCTSHSV